MPGSNIAHEEKIDHLRAVGALQVILCHTFHPLYHSFTGTWGTQIKNAPLLSPILEGHSAVGLFITLSGFLFARICNGKDIDLKQFYWNRFLRIYPLYAVAVWLAVCVSREADLAKISSSLLMLGGGVKGVFTNHLWTVMVEAHFYLLFPFLVVLFRTERAKGLLGVCAILMIILLSVFLAYGTVQELAYLTIFGRLSQSALGMLIGFHFDTLSKKLKPVGFFIASVITLVLVLHGFHLLGGFPLSKSPIWIVWPTAEALVWGFVIASYCSTSWSPSRLIRSCLNKVGTIRYSLYVNHYFASCVLPLSLFTLISEYHHRYPYFYPIQKFMMAHPLATSLILPVVVILPPVILTSILTYRFIEKPFLSLKKTYTETPLIAGKSSRPQHDLVASR